jgi:hypothetical protein
MSDREAMKLALDFVTSKQWGTRPYMEDGVFTDAFVLAEALRTALAAPSPEPEPVALAHCPYTPPPSAHFGYVLDGEAEAEVLKDCGWERVTDAEALRQDAERYRWLRGEHSRIDPCIKANAKYKLERQSSTWVNIHDLDAAIDAAMKEGT